jgi:prepilin-type N-terminal cleavage/methylation domain-containing protein
MELRGFSYLEVLIALTLFSVGMMAVVGMFGVSAQALNAGGTRTQAVFLAQNKMEQLKMDHARWLGEGQSAQLGWIRLTWEVKKDYPSLGLNRLSVIASWYGPTGKNRSVRFITLVPNTMVTAYEDSPSEEFWPDPD